MFKAKEPIKQIELFAYVTRADGTIEPSRRVSYYHRNPVVRLWIRWKNKLGKVSWA